MMYLPSRNPDLHCFFVCVVFHIFRVLFLINGSLALEMPIGLLIGCGLIDTNRCQLTNRKLIGSA